MNLPDPEDPDFKAVMREMFVRLGGGILFVIAIVCVIIFFLSPQGS